MARCRYRLCDKLYQPAAYPPGPWHTYCSPECGERDLGLRPAAPAVIWDACHPDDELHPRPPMLPGLELGAGASARDSQFSTPWGWPGAGHDARVYNQDATRGGGAYVEPWHTPPQSRRGSSIGSRAPTLSRTASFHSQSPETREDYGYDADYDDRSYSNESDRRGRSPSVHSLGTHTYTPRVPLPSVPETQDHHQTSSVVNSGVYTSTHGPWSAQGPQSMAPVPVPYLVIPLPHVYHPSSLPLPPPGATPYPGSALGPRSVFPTYPVFYCPPMQAAPSSGRPSSGYMMPGGRWGEGTSKLPGGNPSSHRGGR
ncbi:hypothetical protein C8Q77DRAFT_263716 [Trametes polyzona]|nr:hypothetical protein C8Q77DRAFT_263716 [Trametes polyzona]